MSQDVVLSEATNQPQFFSRLITVTLVCMLFCGLYTQAWHLGLFGIENPVLVGAPGDLHKEGPLPFFIFNGRNFDVLKILPLATFVLAAVVPLKTASNGLRYFYRSLLVTMLPLAVTACINGIANAFWPKF